jgi:hypothetical protein
MGCGRGDRHAQAPVAYRQFARRGVRTMALNIMVLESEHGAATEATRELTEAGHTVLRCHDEGASVFPCRGLADESACHLRSHAVDVALTVRSGVFAQPTPLEDGARCALMQHVPLVVAGPSIFDPYTDLEEAVLDRTDDVVAACEEAASAELRRYARRAEAVITGTIESLPSVPTVTVVRRDGGLRVTIGGLAGRTERERQIAAVRVVGAMHGLDRAARTIDVSLVDSPSTAFTR